jgi:hypothetical protein
VRCNTVSYSVLLLTQVGQRKFNAILQVIRGGECGTFTQQHMGIKTPSGVRTERHEWIEQTAPRLVNVLLVTRQYFSSPGPKRAVLFISINGPSDMEMETNFDFTIYVNLYSCTNMVD